jgi:hypothetical protein
MSVCSPITPIQLTWVKSKIKGRHELTAAGPMLGSLQRVGFWKRPTQAEFQGKTWSFQRRGFRRTCIMEEPGARPIAQFKHNWFGGGVLRFNDGDFFHLTATAFWRPVWAWFDRQGNKLLEVVPHEKSVRVTMAAGDREIKNAHATAACSTAAGSPHTAAAAQGIGSVSSAAEQSRVTGSRLQQSKLQVLIMFSWHQVLQTNNDAAAVAAISAASVG